jgi:hypothetical protein
MLDHPICRIDVASAQASPFGERCESYVVLVQFIGSLAKEDAVVPTPACGLGSELNCTNI